MRKRATYELELPEGIYAGPFFGSDGSRGDRWWDRKGKQLQLIEDRHTKGHLGCICQDEPAKLTYLASRLEWSRNRGVEDCERDQACPGRRPQHGQKRETSFAGLQDRPRIMCKRAKRWIQAMRAVKS